MLNMNTKHFLEIVSISLIILILVAVFHYIFPRKPIGVPEVVDHLIIDNDTEIMLVQTFTGTFEPYEVILYYLDESGMWGSYYVDHEAFRWYGKFFMEDENVVKFKYRSSILLEFHIDEQKLVGPGKRIAYGSFHSEPNSPLINISDSH